MDSSKNVQRFEDFELSKKLQEAVLEARLEKPTELQMQVIPLALENRDIIFEARSGMGKSACFAIPFLQHWLRERERKAIIITPTSDSVQQLGKVISRLCPTLKARVLKFTKKDDYFYPEFHEKSPIVILEYAVADRFVKREKEFMAQVKSLGLDELDKLIENEKELSDLIQTINPDRQTLICANELTEHVLEKGRWFCDPNRLEKVKLSRPETQWSAEQMKLQYLMVDEGMRTAQVADLLRANESKVTMIITDSDRISRFVSEKLAEESITAEVLAYSMQLDEKQQLASKVTESGKGVLVGCEAAFNGLSLPKIDVLVSWELPSQLESYWKRLDRFAYQGELNAIVIVDQPRVGAIRILERRLGRPMECLNPERTSQPMSRPPRREPSGSYEHRETRPVREAQPVQEAKPKKEIPVWVGPTGLILPERYRQTVCASKQELDKYAPQGTMKKNLGSKFVPARKKKGKSAERD